MDFPWRHVDHAQPLRRGPGIALAASAVALLAASPAAAACSPGAGGPRDFLCVGSIGLVDLTMARTIALQGAKFTAPLTFAPISGGNIGFSMDGKSSIAGGLFLMTSNGSIDTATPNGSGINGAITALNGAAIYASTSGLGSNISITTGTGGVLSGTRGGLLAFTDTNGSINLNIGGKVTATAGWGVYAGAVDGAINIGASADIVGGIGAQTTGKGAINVTATGDISTTFGTAVYAGALGGGNVSLNLMGDLKGAIGIQAISGGGDVTVTAAGKVEGADAIIAATTGKGAVTVTTGDTVTARTGDGISTSTEDGWNTVNVGAGGVAAARNGVLAVATGDGSVKIDAHGDISGATGYGVAAATASGSIEIDLDAGKFISGANAGIALQTDTGEATINNAGEIKSTGKGAAIIADMNNGDLTLNNTGKISGGDGGVAIAVTSGAALIDNSGEIDGKILSAGLTTVKNDGVWNNAAGSYINYLTNNGTIVMGKVGGDLGVLAVTGDASFGPNSYYNARFTATGSDVIVVAGKTTIDGGVVQISGADKDFQRGAKYLILYSKDGVDGKFDGVKTDIKGYTGLLTYDENDVYMTLLLRDFRNFATNANQRAIANAIYYGSAFLRAGLSGSFMTALNLTKNKNIASTLSQLTGDGVVTGATNASLLASHMFSGAMDDQVSTWREGVPRDAAIRSIRPFQYAPIRTDSSAWPVSRQTNAPPPEDPSLKRWRVWSTGFGGRETLAGDRSDGSATQKTTVYGGALGVDYQIGSRLLVGVAGGGSTSSFQVANVSGNAAGGHVGAYAGYRVGGFYGSASVAYNVFSNRTQRTLGAIGAVAGEQEDGHFDSSEVRTRLEVGRRLEMGALSITPFTAVEIAHIHTKPFVETSVNALGGTGLFSLSYAGQGTTSTPSFIGAKAQARIDMGGVVFAPWIGVAWRHEWSASRTQTASLVALPTASFVAIGARPSRDAMQVKGGATLEVSRTAAIFASFEGEFSGKNPIYTGRGGVKIGW